MDFNSTPRNNKLLFDTFLSENAFFDLGITFKLQVFRSLMVILRTKNKFLSFSRRLQICKKKECV